MVFVGKIDPLCWVVVLHIDYHVWGNPQHDAFGFRNWNVAGGPIGMKYATGSLGRFQGFLASLRLSSSFTCVGSEYVSMTAGECVNPRVNMAIAFRTVLYRLVFLRWWSIIGFNLDCIQ